jgi:glycine/D-amino acid oxidase-like deaminating enzyme
MANEVGSELTGTSRVYTSFVDPLNTQSTVIVGAGIIGCATAYHLATSGNTKPDTIHLVEASSELFASASGKAAGFVAPDCMHCPPPKLT